MNTISEYCKFYQQYMFPQICLEKVQKQMVEQELFKQGISGNVGDYCI